MNSSDFFKPLISKYAAYVHIGLILLWGMVSYANSLGIPLQFDDESVVRVANNLNTNLFSIQEFIRRSRWFADTTFFLNRHLHGEQVLGYHVVNLAVHLLSSVVVYLFVRRAIQALQRTVQISRHEKTYCVFLEHFIPFTTAAIFVCHPVQTQAVTYIAQRYTSLATLLYISSLLAYLLARLSSTDGGKKIHVWAWSVICFFFAVLSMKSKEIAFTLPLMLVVLEAALFKGTLLKNRFFLVSGTVLLLVIPIQLITRSGTLDFENLLQHIQAATRETPLISRTDYLLTQFRVVATYLRLLVLPINQNLDYDYPVYYSLSDPAVFAAFLLHITLAVTALALFIRSKQHFASSSPTAGIPLRIAGLGIIWFYLALSVESSVIPINDVIFEHRVYLPSVGFFMAAAACLTSIAVHKHYRNVLWSMTVLICFILTASTIARNRTWASEMGLWQDVLAKSPHKARVRHSIGVLYFRKFKPDEALPHLVRAVELEPSTEKYWISLNSQVSILAGYQGRCSEGMEYHASIDKVAPTYKKPWAAISYNNLGLAYEYLGKPNLAMENYQKAITINPALDIAWYNLALVAARKNNAATTATALKNLNVINPLLEQNAAKIIREQQPSVQLIP